MFTLSGAAEWCGVRSPWLSVFGVLELVVRFREEHSLARFLTSLYARFPTDPDSQTLFVFSSIPSFAMPSPTSPSPTTTMTMEWPPKSSSYWPPPSTSLAIDSDPSTPTSPLAAQPSFMADMDDEMRRLRETMVKNLSTNPLPSKAQSPKTLGHPPDRRSFAPLKTGSTGSSVGLTDSSGGTTSTGTISPASPNSNQDAYSPNDIIADYADEPRPIKSASIDPLPSPRATAIDGVALARSLTTSKKKPLVLDTRSPDAYAIERIKGSLNVAIPTLFLKRYKRTSPPDVRWLRDYVPSDEWERVMAEWDGSVIVCDEDMDSRGTAPLLVNALSARWLQGGLASFRSGHPELIVRPEPLTDLDLTHSPVSDSPSSLGGASESAVEPYLNTPGFKSNAPTAATVPSLPPQEGGASLDSHARQRVSPNPAIGGEAQPLRSRATPPRTLVHTKSMVSLPSSSSSSPPNYSNLSPPPVPSKIDASSPSSPPPAMPFPTPRGRSNTALLNKKSKDRLAMMRPINTNLAQNPTPSTQDMRPALSLLTRPIKSATLAAPIASPKVSGFGLRLNIPPSPSKIVFGAAAAPPINIKSPQSGTSVFFTPVETPSQYANTYLETPVESSFHTGMYDLDVGLNSGGATPLTARPPPSPSLLTSESESAMPPFVISTILPGFLYLGPELGNEEQAEELEGLGVKRILNMAIECEPEDYNLDLEKRFERYNKIPMRDTVEEDRIGRGLKEVCELLGEHGILLAVELAPLTNNCPST